LSKIKIRFNTKDTDGSFPWRIFIDDKEFLASDIEIKGTAVGEKSIENDVVKWNIVCIGTVVWDNNKITIYSK
jgi:hypothetical protein